MFHDRRLGDDAHHVTNESNIKHFTKAEISKKKKRSEFQFM